MIQANEIKPNNIIDTPYGIATVYGVSKDCVQITLKDNESVFDFDLEDAKPIELTEEWHNKFGVFKNGFGNFEYRFENKFNLFLTFVFTGDYVMIRQGKEKRIDDDIVSIFNKDLTKRNMYVHEFQNIVHALTQTELEINL